MKRTLFKKVLLVLATVVLILSFAGCSAAYNSTEKSADNWSSESESSGDLLNSETSDENRENVSTNRKIIEKIYLTVQTKEFDILLDKIETELNALGGYTESSSVSGGEKEGKRYAVFTIRIPAEHSKDFTAFVSENSTVTNKEVETEDVTLSYVDMESRVSALETEKASLEKLLSEATALSDIISIQDRLTEVIYEIESYKSKLRTYDSLIDYTTVTIRISEVDRVASAEEQSMWAEIGTNLKDNFQNIGYGLKRFFIWLVSALPYMLLLGIIGLIPLIIVRICTRRKHKKG